MNRTIYWSQEQLRSFDLLWFEKDVLSALGGLESDVAGATTTVCGGLAATQTVVASLTINIAAGRIYQQAAIDASSFGALPLDASVIQQSGYAAAQQVTLSTSGISSGQSRWSLIQAQFSSVDSVRTGDPTAGVLYYYNSANPSSPFQGPGNAGSPNNTVRSGVCVIQVVNGSAATTGSEVPPNPTAGWVPLYLIDLAFGQTQILTAQILLANPSVGTNVPNNYPGAPILAGLLNSHHSGLAGNAPKIKLTSEVQGILPLANLPVSSAPAGGGLSTVQAYAGNPNGHVAGNQGVAGTSPPDLCWNTLSNTWWTCITTGTTSTAVWSLLSTSFLTTNLSLFVNNVTGNDNNTGLSSGAAYATIAKAAAQIPLYNLNGFTLTISIATTGTTYVGAAFPAQNGSGNVSIISTGGTPIVAGTNASAFTFNRAIGTWTLTNFSVATSGTSSTDPLAGVYVNGSGCAVTLVNMVYGACLGGHKLIGQGAIGGESGTITVVGGCAGSTLGVGAHVQCISGGVFQTSTSPTLTISAAVTVNYWIYANQLSYVSIVYGSITNPGNDTGTRYFAGFNAVISTGGLGATYYPGTVAGSTSYGGQYD